MADGLPESDVVTKELLEKALQSNDGGKSVTVKTFAVSEGCNKGDNFICVILAVRITALHGDQEKSHNLVVKTLSSSNVLLKQWVLHMSKMFYKEAMTYKELIPDMVEYQIQKGVSVVSPPMPMYYHSVVDDNNGILILGDLRPEGYILANIREGVDEEHCKLVMKELGEFHALSWAMKDGDVGNLKKYHYALRESLFINSQVPPPFIETLIYVVNIVKTHAENQEARDRVAKLLSLDLQAVFSKLLTPIEPYGVLCHGDLWCNNILFKYTDTAHGLSPTQVKLIDLQIMRYAPPTTDLAYFLYTSTTRETRMRHLRDLLHLYHSTFMNNLDRLNVQFPDFTFDVLERQFADSALYGILFACILLPIILSEPESAAPKFEKQTTIEDAERNHAEFLKRLSEKSDNNTVIQGRLVEVIEDAIELGLI